MLPFTPTTCPACGAHVSGALPTSSLADHAVASHGVVRAPLVMATAGAFAAAGLLVVAEGLKLLSHLGDATEASGKVVVFLATVLLLTMGLGSAFVGLLVWRADQTARVLAYVIGGSLALAGFAKASGETMLTLAAVAAVAGVAMAAFVPDVAAWFEGHFATRHERPAMVVVTRLLLGWTGLLAGISALMYLVIISEVDGQVLPLVLFAGGSGASIVAFLQLDRGEANTRYIASAGCALAALAPVVEDGMGMTSLFILGCGAATAGLLWLTPELNAHFGATGFSIGGGSTSGGWGGDAAASPWGAAPLPPPPGAGAGGAWPSPDDPAAPLPPPSGAGPVSLPPPGSMLPPAAMPPPGSMPPPRAVPPPPTTLPPGAMPAPSTTPPPGGGPVDLPPPGGMPVPGAMPPPSGAPMGAPMASPVAPTRLDLPLPGSPPVPVTPFDPRVETGYTVLSANRLALLLRSSGASVDASDLRAIWLSVPGARIVVASGDSTQVLVEADDEDRLRRVGDVVRANVTPEDPSFELRPTQSELPRPREVEAGPGAGWYADPFESSAIRYWDGRSWTASTSAAP